VTLPNDVDDALLPSLLTLSDVFSTGHHAAVTAGVRKGEGVAVVGDGAVGLCGVLAAQRLGAERIILLGRHTDRTDLGREFGATDVVAERGDEGVAKVMELTGGDGVHSVLECVGLEQALSGRIEPGPGFDRTVDLDGVPDGYRAMNDREALKVLLTP
jgi:threonine dehydrogenase-like Zn-dependent dehydrogenase